MERKNKVRLPLAERLRLQEIERSPDLAPLVIPVLDIPAGYKWHPVAKKIKKQFDQISADAIKKKAQFDWEQKHAGRRYPRETPQSYGWRHFVQAGMPMDTHGGRKIAVRVTLRTYQRALKIINDVCLAASESGFAISLKDGGDSVYLRRSGADVYIRLTEKSRMEFTDVGRVMHPTGHLQLLIRGSGSSTESVIKDGEGSPLESQMDKVLAQIEHRHKGAIAAGERNKIWQQEYAEEQAKRLEELERKETLKRDAEKETKRRDALVLEASTWQKAELIRQYLAALDARIEEGGVPAPDYETWKAWAALVANDFDSKRVRRGADEIQI